MPFKDPARKKAYQREWIAKNAERHRELSREAMRRWMARHPEVHRARKIAYVKANPERRRVSEARYRERYPEKRRAVHRARRARVQGAEGRFTVVEWLALLESCGQHCAYCGRSGVLQPEHRTPLVRGGSNFIGNILPACPRCNQQKGRLTEEEFRARRKTSI